MGKASHLFVVGMAGESVEFVDSPLQQLGNIKNFHRPFLMPSCSLQHALYVVFFQFTCQQRKSFAEKGCEVGALLFLYPANFRSQAVHVTAFHDRRLHQCVFKLSNVARPCISIEAGHGFTRYSTDVLAQIAVDLAQQWKPETSPGRSALVIDAARGQVKRSSRNSVEATRSCKSTLVAVIKRAELLFTCVLPTGL